MKIPPVFLAWQEGNKRIDLDRGVIDATEWVGPYHDYKMGFYKAAKYYYSPGWHEPGTTLECMVNKQKYDALPKNLQAIIETACARSNIWCLSTFEALNEIYLRKLVNEHHVQVLTFPDAVLAKLKVMTKEVLDDMAARDPFIKKVYDAYMTFKKNHDAWDGISEERYAKLKHL